MHGQFTAVCSYLSGPIPSQWMFGDKRDATLVVFPGFLLSRKTAGAGGFSFFKAGKGIERGKYHVYCV